MTQSNLNKLKRSCKIFVGDDEMDTANCILEILKKNGYRRVRATSCIQDFAEVEGYDIVILDIFWSKEKSRPSNTDEYFGYEAMEYVRRVNPNSRVILMSVHTFDLDHLYKIQRADGFFKVSANAVQILDLIAGVMIGKQLPNQVEINQPSPFLIERQPKTLATKVYNHLLIAEQTLLDGRPDLFGFSNEKYVEILNKTRELKTECLQEKANTSRLKGGIDMMRDMASSRTGNVFDLFTFIFKLLS